MATTAPARQRIAALILQASIDHGLPYPDCMSFDSEDGISMFFGRDSQMAAWNAHMGGRWNLSMCSVDDWHGVYICLYSHHGPEVDQVDDDTRTLAGQVIGRALDIAAQVPAVTA